MLDNIKNEIKDKMKRKDEIKKYIRWKKLFEIFLDKMEILFPNLREVRNSIAHYEDRIQNKGPYGKKAINDDTNVFLGNLFDDKYQTEIYIKVNNNKTKQKKEEKYEKKRITIDLDKTKLLEFKELLLNLLIDLSKKEP
ncbi:hypothetical protein [Marinitoga lauensis]|uniref:hypothetical protein n=1 Tax=Marinitoga lauensis TaxID=2201189 RepID=UPI001011C10D|nr:hypothetical protein [Marinitoga lauensis]